jgi:hypothetical protein
MLKMVVCVGWLASMSLQYSVGLNKTPKRIKQILEIITHIIREIWKLQQMLTKKKKKVWCCWNSNTSRNSGHCKLRSMKYSLNLRNKNQSQLFHYWRHGIKVSTAASKPKFSIACSRGRVWTNSSDTRMFIWVSNAYTERNKILFPFLQPGVHMSLHDRLCASFTIWNRPKSRVQRFPAHLSRTNKERLLEGTLIPN